jgi:hypothetical protein
MGKTS